MNSQSTASDRLFLALDVDSIDQARRLVHELDGVVRLYKVGMGLQLDPGVNGFIRELIEAGNKVFLDYKYLDIEATVERAVSQAAKLGVSFLTLHHAPGSILRAAVRARAASPLKLLVVTVLTSIDAAGLAELGYSCTVEELVLRRAEQAAEAGCDGVVASGREAALIRSRVGDKLLIVTPGIRPEGSGADDQKRTMSPREAIDAGADFLVVGRPILAAPNPGHAAKEILGQIQSAIEERSHSK